LKKSIKHCAYGFLAAAGSAFVLVACNSNNSEEHAVTTYNVSGWVSRSESIILGDVNDGMGTLYIAAFAECRLGAEQTGSGIEMDADLSVTGVMESFKVSQLQAGIHHLAVFLDVNDDALLSGPPLPGPMDLVYAPSGVDDDKLDCVEVNIQDTDLLDVGIELNGVVPG